MQATYIMAANKKALEFLPEGADLNAMTYDQLIAWSKNMAEKMQGRTLSGEAFMRTVLDEVRRRVDDPPFLETEEAAQLPARGRQDSGGALVAVRAEQAREVAVAWRGRGRGHQAPPSAWSDSAQAAASSA